MAARRDEFVASARSLGRTATVALACSALTLACATEQAVVSTTTHAAPRAPQGQARCTQAHEHLTLSDSAAGNFLVIRSGVDGYVLILPDATDWVVRCENPPSSSGSASGVPEEDPVVLSAESVSRANVVEVRARPPRDTDDDGRLVPSAFLRTSLRLAGALGAVSHPEVITVGGASVGEYDIESRDERNGQRIVVHHVRAVRLRSDGRALDLELRTLPRVSQDVREVTLMRYAAAHFADPAAIPVRDVPQER